jgi:16S rRNA (cytidine1402-2'-O)-methyltransferase
MHGGPAALLILGAVEGGVNFESGSQPSALSFQSKARCYASAMTAQSSREERALDPGPTVYVVATPIGNLEDITLRALRILKGVDVIACEDTRQTQKLLNHYGIATRAVSYHEHNERERAAELAADLGKGARIALVTDAGMPGISDPGFRLIQAAIELGVPVVPIPGASAFLSALAASGLPTDAFEFRGFLPAKRGERRTALERIRDATCTQAFYEAPHRIVEALEDVVEILGPERRVVVGRELTKVHEEFLRGPAGGLFETLKTRGDVKGEITLLVGKAASSEPRAAGSVTLAQRVKQIMAEDQVDEKAALKKVAKERGIGKSEAYREWQRGK